MEKKEQLPFALEDPAERSRLNRAMSQVQTAMISVDHLLLAYGGPSKECDRRIHALYGKIREVHEELGSLLMLRYDEVLDKLPPKEDPAAPETECKHGVLQLSCEQCNPQ